MISAKKSCHGFGSALLVKYLLAMQAEIDGVKLSEDPEFLHRMRVAARRLRTTLLIFEDCLPDKKSVKFRKKIRNLSGVLGRARDADVQVIFLKEFLSGLPEKKYVDGIKRMLLRTEQTRKRLHPELVYAIEDAVLEGLFKDMEKAFKNASLKDKCKDDRHSLLSRFNKEVRIRLEEIMGYDDVIRYPENVDELHEMRIAVKHLRYCLEIFEPVLEGLGKYIKTAKHLQEMLGDIHDCDVWLNFIPGFITDEEARVFEYCGNSAPMARLKPGIMYLYDERQSFRQKRYTDFIDLWVSSAAVLDDLHARLKI